MNQLNVYDHDEYFYIGVRELSRDRDVAGLLNMSRTKYRNILKRYNATKDWDGEIYFENKWDAESCLNFLASLLIMEVLMK